MTSQPPSRVNKGSTSAGGRCRGSLIIIGLLGLLAGCEGSLPKLGSWDGPQLLSTRSVEPWTFRGNKARKIRSNHYVIYTTIDDEETLELIPQVMEGALAQYHKVAPVPLSTESPMECFIFERRLEWEAFTRATTGKDAEIYLQIRRGGYAVRDRFVAYYIGRQSTVAVAAHEGWHQYVARNFHGRLPPFIEEGFACMFEGIGWKDDLPRWNLAINQVRVQALRRAAENRQLWPLDKLIATHAGEVVEEKGERVEAFYAQAWAFARFLNEGEGGRFRPAMQKWMMDTANGHVFDPSNTHNQLTGPWNRRAVKPILEHYLNLDFGEIDKLYQAYVKKVAFDQYSAQWNS